MRDAVIGIGSNSTRLLVGEEDGGMLRMVLREREGTRLFAGLEADGSLSAQSMATTLEAVVRFAAAARGAGARSVHIIATSAARDAANGEAFAALVEEATGLPLSIIPGEEEARLSFLGATEGGQYAGVLDIGGGSTELAIGGGGEPLAAASAQLGAVRLFGEAPLLTDDGFDEALALARGRIAEARAAMPATLPPPAEWYGVGGTLTCLASIDMALPTFDRDAVDGHQLSRGAVENWARRLAKLKAYERAALPGMLSQRADIIAHGAIVLLAAMEEMDIRRLTVRNRTNLDGYLIDRMAARNPADPVATVRGYYNEAVEKEWARLERGWFEYEINCHYIDRFVNPGDRVLDIGGGPGRYSLHLASRGADVTLVDLSEGNVDFALAKAREQGVALTGRQGDARVIDALVEGPYDTILLMGPLYHLLEEGDRVRTVEACLRLLRPGGTLCVAFISMVAGMIYAARELPESILWAGEDMFYEKIVRQEDFAGQAFTQAYFIQPKNVRPFMARFPLEPLHLVASEGITAPFTNSLMAADEPVRRRWLALALSLCEREDFLGYTEHLLYIGRKREEP